jgi:hypothetical protein
MDLRVPFYKMIPAGKSKKKYKKIKFLGMACRELGFRRRRNDKLIEQVGRLKVV